MADSPKQQDPAKKTALWVAVFTLSLLLVYALSLGPVLLIAKKLGMSPQGTTGMALKYIYYPHLWFASEQQWYFSYVCWCANESYSADGYEDFQARFRSGKILN